MYARIYLKCGRDVWTDLFEVWKVAALADSAEHMQSQLDAARSELARVTALERSTMVDASMVAVAGSSHNCTEHEQREDVQLEVF